MLYQAELQAHINIKCKKDNKNIYFKKNKGGDPAAGSPTATL